MQRNSLRSLQWLIWWLLAAALSGSLPTSGLAEPQDAPGSAKTQAGRVGRSDSGQALFFDGFIDDEAVSRFEDELRRSTAGELWIRSTGGSVAASIRFGEAVRDAGLVVVVKGYCASSCANYVFTAGKSRIIDGVVAWHGSLEQKDFRELHLCGRTYSSLFGTRMPQWSEAEREEALASWNKYRARQAAFFDSIGVDEYITRAGQEPNFLRGDFTYDVATMEAFGLRNIAAPDGYGTEAWCRLANAGRSKTRLNCVKVTEEMLLHERARRERGEECQADGTLRIKAH